MASQQWRVKPVLPIVKLVGALALIAAGLLFSGTDVIQWVLSLGAGLGLVLWGARDLIRPIRLAADTAGITVPAGLLSQRHLPWPAIERIQVDRRSRRGIRSELLEIDAGESLHFFSHLELGGADPDDVAGALSALRAQALSHP